MHLNLMNKQILTLLFVFLSFQSFAELRGQARLDSLLAVLPAQKEDSNKVSTLSFIGMSYRKFDSDKAISYGQESVALARKLKEKDILATAIYNLGNTYLRFEKYKEAMALFFEALEITRESGDKEGTAALLVNISNAYMVQSDYPHALEYLLEAIKLFEENGNKFGEGSSLLNIGNIYSELSDQKNALSYFKRALTVYEAIGNKLYIALAIGNIGSVYSDLGQYEQAMTFLEKSLVLYKEIGDPEGVERNLSNIGDIYLKKGDYKNALSNASEAFRIADELGSAENKGYDCLSLSKIYLAIYNDSKNNATESVAGVTKEKALSLAKQYVDTAVILLKEVGVLNTLSGAMEQLSKIDSIQGDFKSAFVNYKYFKLLNDSIFNIEKDKKITKTAMQYDFDKKEAAAKAENEKKSIRQRNIRNSITAGLAGALLFLIVVLRQRNRIAKEKQHSEELLLNILPEEVAEELKQKGSADAKQFEEVTVMFTDFKGFTQISEKLSPTELVNEIHTCFKAFDQIIGKHNIEKIKTIGDSYMCAGGLPIANKTHAADVVNAALEIQLFMQEHLMQRKKENKEIFEIRIGIHTGTVVAGIVGIKKFAYDIWGDTVNIASRMESSGESGKVNISGSTYELVKDKFTCTHRGKIEAKNKGQIDMYFVDRSF